MTSHIAITYDYLCPFARNANEALVEYLNQGADVEVRFVPFSLTENSLGEDERSVWDDPTGVERRGVRAMLWSLAVRSMYPDAFARFHVLLFNARHDDGADIDDPSVLAEVARRAGIDPAAVADEVASGVPMKTLASEHTALVDEHGVFGVPTFIAGEEAVFVRLMDRHAPHDIARTIEMLSWTSMNEFKRTRIPR